MHPLRNLAVTALLAFSTLALGCGGGSASYYPSRSRAPVATGQAASPEARAYDARSQSDEAEPSRPGLGTGWGETRVSYSSSTPFVREDFNRPWGAGTVWYNDEDGVRAMTRDGGYSASGGYPLIGGMITVRLTDGSGRAYPTVHASGRQYVVGEAGERYVIAVTNRSGFRFECVASVDGLDVIDGEPASYGKRGYVLDPYGTLEIEGFRRSEDTVAAFRFSSVRGSYASRSGQGDRNVGVIGIALFQERGSYPVWNEREVYRRHQADPFPQQYARPPY